MIAAAFGTEQTMVLIACMVTLAVCAVVCTYALTEKYRQGEEKAEEEEEFDPRTKIRDMTVETFMSMAERARERRQ